MKRYNTPHRSRVVKTRMTEEEYAEFAQRLSAYNMSQAEFIRQAITGAAIRPIITVSPVNDELLAAVGKLTAEYGRIGGNLNQIARTLKHFLFKFTLFSIILPNLINNPTYITRNLSFTLMNIFIDFLFLLNSNLYIFCQFSNR